MPTHIDFTTTTIDQLKIGDYFRFPGQKKVRIRKEYNRNTGKYMFVNFDDCLSDGDERKKGTPVEINFDF